MERADHLTDADELVICSLEGVRVVDLTSNVAGPFATQILGDLGATVIKVERPGGDDTRGWGPPFWTGGSSRLSVSFSALNRNKTSVVLDLKQDEDIATLRALLAEADVLVQSLRPGTLDRLGLTRKALDDLNPMLIYCEITGYGQVGPLAGQPAYDPLMQAYSGLMSITGEEGGAPVRIPVSILDKGTGLWAVIGIMNALRLREQSGRGCHVGVSLLETALDWEASQVMMNIASGRAATKLGSAAPGIAPYQAFATANSHIIISAGNERLWKALCGVLGREDLLHDERFVDNAHRFSERVALAEEIERTLTTAPATVWLGKLEAAGVPCAPIRTLDEIPRDEHVASLRMFSRGTHPEFGEMSVMATPIVTDGQRFPIRTLPPALGEGTERVRAGLDIGKGGQDPE